MGTREGLAKLEAGDLAGAEAEFLPVLFANPKDVPALHGLARVAMGARRFDVATDLLGQAKKLEPASERLALDFLEACSALASQQPGNASVHYALAQGFLELGDIEAARDALVASLMADPRHVQARWLVNRLLPRVCGNPQEIALWRRRTATGIAILDATVHPASPEASALELPGLLARTNFDLAYQGQDDRQFQEIYGRLVHRAMTAWLPDLAEPLLPVPFVFREDKRIRIGFASAHFTRHTVFMFLSGWIRHLDKSRFKVFCYLVNATPDDWTQEIAGACDEFRHLQCALEDSARNIRADALDVLIYPDVGMDARSFALAAIRLAPVQMAGMGHPVTTGLPSIDIFLSGELLETEASETHYSEKLVRLPGISVCYHPLQTQQTKQRADFGLDGADTIYLCCQPHQKYLPQSDGVFTEIAGLVPQAKFLFFDHPARHYDNYRFKARLRQAFLARGLDPARHLIFMPRQAWEDFIQLYGLCDVFLDSFGWSGGNTSFEALSRSLPIVTLPAPLMRGRQSFAMLKILGLDECIARDALDYVKIAVRLGTDQDWNRHIRGRIAQERGKLFDDLTPVRALEAVVAQAVVG
ncbi:MAG: hypothetical protein EPN26_02575 [Rhodospirillales bacterium]|nr:MAG: hypothetical protein EPN26_02575 [Rhodospirillales bacterium]